MFCLKCNMVVLGSGYKEIQEPNTNQEQHVILTALAKLSLLILVDRGACNNDGC